MEDLYRILKYNIYKNNNNIVPNDLNKLIDIEIKKQIKMVKELLRTDINIILESYLLLDLFFLENKLNIDHYANFKFNLIDTYKRFQNPN